ncbi:transcription factor E2F7-like isoform X2 [Pomacea canaliculata]|nr:transcription factor E2F7-like isoform X2 [Pomacea canaliculata]
MADVNSIGQRSTKSSSPKKIADIQFRLTERSENTVDTQTVWKHDLKICCDTEAGRPRSKNCLKGKENRMKRSASLMSRNRKHLQRKCGLQNGQVGNFHRSFSDTNGLADKLRVSEDTRGSQNKERTFKESLKCSSATPSKELEEAMEAPPSPTANLKMLISAISPDIRKMERGQQVIDQAENSQDVLGDESSMEPVEMDSEFASSQEGDCVKHCAGSRKEKSLGLLCQKFIQKYPSYPPSDETIEIGLDEVAKDLNVERRRIYDIVNVLESVEVVSRLAKNKYAWHGKTNLVHTLAKLKVLAIKEGFAERIERMKNKALDQEVDSKAGHSLLPSKTNQESEDLFHSNDDCLEDLKQKVEMRKEKSLGIMSQKFLMLFLISEQKKINLDFSAKVLIGDADLDKQESSKFKTKIRRLYDIANILTSLRLIKKVHVIEIRGRKPAFEYIGPELDTLDNVGVCNSDGWHRPSSRHSMLDCVRNENVALLLHNTFRPIRPALPTGFSRHSSFDQICQVAEKERSRLYGCASEPSSPVKKLKFKDAREPKIEVKRCNTDPKSRMELVNSSASPSTNKSIDSVIQHRPVVKRDTLIIKAKSFSGPAASGKQTKPVPFTSDQIHEIIWSIKHPVKTKQDAATQSSPENVQDGPSAAGLLMLSPSEGLSMASINEHTPTAGRVTKCSGQKHCYVEVEVSGCEEKRIKLELTTPPSTGGSKSLPHMQNINRGLNTEKLVIKPKGKSSSTRALTFLSDETHESTQHSSDPLMALCAPKPVATRPQPNVHHVTMQLPNSQASASSVYHVPVMNALQEDVSKPTKIVLSNGNFSSASVVNPTTPTLVSLPSTYMPHCRMLPSYKTSPADKPVQILSHSSMVLPGSSSQPVNIMVPVTFSPPLTPSEDNPCSSVMFTFPGMGSPQACTPAPPLQSQSTAFQVVQHSASSSLRMLPASPPSSQATSHIRIVLPVTDASSAATLAIPSPFVTCANSAILQARTADS